MAKTHEKMLSTSLIREMQINTAMRYHLTPVRVAVIKKITNDQVLAKMWRKGDTYTLLT